MTRRRSKLRSRFLAPAWGVALMLLGVASFGGCFVSFDGYELADAGGSSNDASGSGGDVNGGGDESTLGGGGEVGASGSASIGGSPIGGAAGGGGTNSGGSATAGSSAGGMPNGGVAGTMAGSGAISGAAGKAGSGGSASAGSNAGGSAGTSAAGSAGNAGSGGNPASCPVPLHGAILVEIPKPGGGIYCIDRTEVTNQDYATFLASNPNPAAQAGVCAQNANFAPAMDSLNCTQYDPSGKPKVPVACVDWCDAQAYCAWAGKHLCGKIGGGTNPPASFADATKSEWFAACSDGGTLAFPYGNSYQPDGCVGADGSATRPTAVPTASCTGGYDGLYDMSGNVSEWEDSCTGTASMSDQCLYRGGSYADIDVAAPALTCNSTPKGGTVKAALIARSSRNPEIGFRCCLDP